MLYYFYYSLQLRPSLLKWFIILASCPACFQSPPTIQLANSQPRELALTTHLGANRLVGLSSLSSTNYNKRASTRLLQGQGKLLRRLMVLSIRKRSLTSQLMGLQRNLQCLLISHLTKRTARWSSSRVSLRTRIGMTVVTEMGIEMAQCQVWKIMEVTLGTPDVKSGPMRCQKGLQLQLICCAPFRLLSQDFRMRRLENQRMEDQSEGQSCSWSRT